jgi:hypothetical protein
MRLRIAVGRDSSPALLYENGKKQGPLIRTGAGVSD